MKDHIRKQIIEQRGRLDDFAIHMSRVPKNTYIRFMEIANVDDFCGDYGMALKTLIDFFDGLIPSGIEHLELEIDSLRREVEQLKASSIKKEEKANQRVSLSGRPLHSLGKGGKEDGSIK